ncbi:MAG: tryptophan--tRNA ligase [Patescibacteria group bacterium]|nr:tryptophan--tRNA ligase [Patescibacteria group bacterium]
MKKRILTGDRPTGKLHLGHYVGTLKNRVALQNEYDCFFIIADLHMLTTKYQDLKTVKQNINDLVLDYLSVGIDPQKSNIFVQSLIPQIPSLFTLFTMLTTVPRLQRVPTLKDVMRDLKIETASLGLLSYPVLQAADILIVRANLVPVGKDQASHIEVTREIAQRFNSLYGEVFPLPEVLIGEVPTLPGIDGKAKMSKSLENAIYLSDDSESVLEKVMRMYTDPTRLRPTDPGHVEGNPVFIYHEAFNKDKEEVADLEKRYREGRVGDVEVKEKLAKALNGFLEPIRAKRKEYEGRPELIEKIILEGSERIQAEGKETLDLVKKAMGLKYFD